MSIEKVTQAKSEIAQTAAYATLTAFFDDGEFTDIAGLARSGDAFTEVAAGHGTVNGVETYAFAQNPDFCGGAMSKAQAKKLRKVYDLALMTGTPVVGFYNSKGGRIDEGNALLAGYGDVLNAASKLSGVVPQISVILGDCIGTGALNAFCADFVIAAEGSRFSLSTMGEDADVQTNAEKGVVSIVAADEADAVEKARELVSRLPMNNIVDAFDDDAVEPEGEGLAHRVCDGGSIIRLSTDFGENARTVLARIDGRTVGVINTLGGSLTSDDAEKIARYVRFCDAFSIPVLSFVNASGFEDVRSAAKVSAAYAEATTAKISVVTGTAVGALYIAMAGTGANADFVYALPEAVISPVNPEAAALIAVPEQMNVSVDEQKNVAARYAAENLSAFNAAENGYVDDVVTEDELRTTVIGAMYILSNKRVATLSKKHSTI